MTDTVEVPDKGVVVLVLMLDEDTNTYKQQFATVHAIFDDQVILIAVDITGERILEKTYACKIDFIHNGEISLSTKKKSYAKMMTKNGKPLTVNDLKEAFDVRDEFKPVESVSRTGLSRFVIIGCGIAAVAIGFLFGVTFPN